jgi:(1->4)-alpha-D-glucan 1-alpha-D-glucosylmutase
MPTDRTSAVPDSTYRLQIRPGFGFDEAAQVVDYLSVLGVSHLYLSPILQATLGSTHGYDVVDHSQLSQQAGGRPGFDRLIAALRAVGLAAVADVVPNHMAVPTPASQNAALWSVLRDGPGSPFASWFDVDWSVESRALLMPVLGARIGTVLADGELVVDSHDGEAVLRYHDHVFPLRPGTEQLPLKELVDRQWYRLAWWRVADDELNYRRFFDVDTLAALRVENPEVFEATHALLLELVRRGDLTGLRIDHPDGLADPRGYLGRLAADVPWVVVEKILTGDEQLPADWPCAGTTGYDALQRIGGLFVDPAAAAPLSALLTEFGDDPDFGAVRGQSKREVVERGLYAELHRLVDLLAEICRDDVTLRDHTRRQLHTCVVELLVTFPRYRAYVVPGEPPPDESVAVVEAAAALVRPTLPDEVRDTLDLVRDLVLDRPVGARASSGREVALRHEFVVRFQQTCGPVMAKGVEDTAFYRWHRWAALNEVGGSPEHVGVPTEEFHAFAAHLQRDWPSSMTTLSTHDTKRSEDVRARLLAVAEYPAEWAAAVRVWSERAAAYRSPAGWPDRPTEYLLWQTLVGTWDDGPIAADRLLPYLTKVAREAKRLTSWTHPDGDYEGGLAAFAQAVLADPDLMVEVGAFCDQVAPSARVAVLGQKLVQLTMPGVPDVYQGCELVDLSLVDPDNRRDVDFAVRRARLAHLDAGGAPRDLDDEKLLVTTRALRLRRRHPQWFVGAGATYVPLATTTGNVIAFGRGSLPEGPVSQDPVQAITVTTRLPVALHRHGGWAEHTVSLPEGRWHDLLADPARAEVAGGPHRVSDLLAGLPACLLVRLRT